MQSAMEATAMVGVTTGVSKGRLWTGRIIAGLIAVFLLLDAVMKLVKPKAVADGFVRSGWPLELSVPLGVVLLISTVLYLIPRTAMLGAILLTGYLGGAVATNLRLESPLFTYTLVPVYMGVLVWLSLWLRDLDLRGMVPLRSR